MCSAFILNKINKAPKEDKEKTANFDKIQYNTILYPFELVYAGHDEGAEAEVYCESLQDAFGRDSLCTNSYKPPGTDAGVIHRTQTHLWGQDLPLKPKGIQPTEPCLVLLKPRQHPGWQHSHCHRGEHFSSQDFFQEKTLLHRFFATDTT